MKPLLFSSLVSLALLSGCSSQFERYTLDDTKERAASSYEIGQILRNEKIKIMMSAIYLNEVYPEYDHDSARFVVGIYSKKPITLYIGEKRAEDGDDGYTLTLKEVLADSYSKLDVDDQLLDLLPVNTRWAEYYFVTFPFPEKGRPVLKLTGKLGKITLEFKDIDQEKTPKGF